MSSTSLFLLLNTICTCMYEAVCLSLLFVLLLLMEGSHLVSKIRLGAHLDKCSFKYLLLTLVSALLTALFNVLSGLVYVLFLRFIFFLLRIWQSCSSKLTTTNHLCQIFLVSCMMKKSLQRC